jgi:hypothetical protein
MRVLALLLLAVAGAPAADWKLVVAGLGGEPDYEVRFARLALDAARFLPGEGAVLSGPSATKERLRQAIEAIAVKAKPEDTLQVLLIGHGTFDGEEYKFNLPGPDVSAGELKAWLDRVPSRQVVVVATSSSGGAAAELRGPLRVVVTATKSGTEKNAVVFSRYWVEALREASADTDKNEAVTAAEAFKFAQRRTAEYFETEKRLATEHPQMEDAENGLLAARTVVVRYGAAQERYNRPEKRYLIQMKEKIEQSIDRLKLEKPAMPPDEYKKKLQQLLLELAAVEGDLEK